MSTEYDQKCWSCKGTGEGNDGACSFCEGYGHHLTREGRELVEFLKRRGVAFPMSPMAEEELRGMVE